MKNQPACGFKEFKINQCPCSSQNFQGNRQTQTTSFYLCRKKQLPLCALLLSVLFCCCAGSLFFSVTCRAEEEQDGETHRITGILPNKSDTVYWQEVTEEMTAAAEEYGIDLTILYTEEINLYTELTLDDALEIASLTETEAVILPYSRADEDTDDLLLQMREQGIKVILIDCDGDAELRDAYIGIDNAAAGYALGSYILNHLDEDKNVILSISISSETKQNIRERISGFQSAFSEQPERLSVFMASTDMELARNMELAEYIEELGNVGAIATLSERSTITGAQVLASMELTDEIDLYGFDQTEDTMNLMEGGQLRALVGQQHRQMARKSIEIALELINGEDLASDICTIEFELICEEEK